MNVHVSVKNYGTFYKSSFYKSACHKSSPVIEIQYDLSEGSKYRLLRLMGWH